MSFLIFATYFCLGILLSPISQGVVIALFIFIGLQLIKSALLNHHFTDENRYMIIGSILGTIIGISILKQDPFWVDIRDINNDYIGIKPDEIKEDLL